MSSHKHKTLASEPSVVRGTHSYSRHLPVLFPVKVDSFNLKSQNQAENIPLVLSRFLLKISRQIGPRVPEL